MESPLKLCKYKIELIITFCAFFCVAFGVIMSIEYSDWTWLERSGSLVVIVAFSTFWKFGLVKRKKLSESLLSYHSEVEEMKKNFRDGKAKPFVVLEVNVEAVKKSIQRNEANYDRLTKFEITLGAIGTFIWGYASPIFNFIAPM